MPLLSASGSFTRYKIAGDVPDAVLRDPVDILKHHAFQDIDATADERSFGWVSFEDMLDNRFASAPPQKAHYLLFALRLDTRRISPAVFKKHLRVALDAERQAGKEDGRNFLTKDRKTEIAEQVRLRLMARSLPIPAVFDVVWNTDTHDVYLNSTNSKVQELFEDMFTLTFELHLERMTPAFLAARILGEVRTKELEDIEPSPFAGGA
ncbi:MAG: hypothetical protein RDU30_08230 [Desulfovibrionaceae bacterium]|nr:hypothetical protein [Desulfovibrionaceae bacterium]